MSLGTKIKTHFTLLLFTTAVLSLCRAVPANAESSPAAQKPPAASPAQEQKIQIKTGNHGAFARAVFDCPKLTAYRVEKTNDTLHIVFDAGEGAALTGERTAQIKKITASKDKDNALNIDIATIAGATYKDFRYGNKIIIDV